MALFLSLSAKFISAEIKTALQLPRFVDEIINTEAAANFFQHLSYTSTILATPFDPGISSGIVSTSMGGLAWIATHQLLASRIAILVYVWLFALIIATVYFRRQGLSLYGSLVGASALCFLFEKIPYSSGYLYNLGELQAALWITVGVLLLSFRPRTGIICLGVSVWLCKLIYLPVALAILCPLLIQEFRETRTIRKPILTASFFFLPLLCWMTLILFKVGPHGYWNWIHQFLGFVKTGNSGLDGAPHVRGLWCRLHDPSLEWVGYPRESQVKFLGLLFAGATIPLYSFLRRLRNPSQKDLTGFFISGVIVFYSAWYFFWHSFMWIRHLQPALFVSFGMIIVGLVRVARHEKIRPHLVRLAPLGYAGMILVSLLSLRSAIRSALEVRSLLGGPAISFAERCRDFKSEQCKE